jgi:hypothetical protein
MIFRISDISFAVFGVRCQVAFNVIDVRLPSPEGGQGEGEKDI